MIDTAREAKLGIGTEWPFEPLDAGECLLTNTFKEVEIGDTVDVVLGTNSLLLAMSRYYMDNIWSHSRRDRIRVHGDALSIECKVVGKIDQSYGKWGKYHYEDALVMEYNKFFPYVNSYLDEDWQETDDFIEWLETPDVLEIFSSFLMVTMPEPRQSYYKSNDFATIKRGVLGYMNQIIDACGTFPVEGTNVLLTAMQLFSYALLFIGLVFNILLIIFVIISVLLIYSLLMITTETKTFDTGIMRLVGLSSGSFVAMILTQAVMFVIPSIITAYICSFPLLWWINSKLLANNLSDGTDISFVPGPIATIEAVGIGILIPSLSAIIPIQRALSKSLSEALNTARQTL